MRWPILSNRFALPLCALLVFLFLILPRVRKAQLASPAEDRASETASQLPPANEVPPLVISTSEQTKTEQYTLSHEKYEKAVAYSRAGYTLYFLSCILGGLFLFLILRLGIAARFRDIAESASQRRWVQGLVFVPLLVLLVDVLDLPVRLYWHHLSLHYEQSVQGWGSWLRDWAKEELVTVVIGIVLASILFAFMRYSPRRWWLLSWVPLVLVLLGYIVIMPLVIDPLFSQFEPLSQQYPDLVASIGKLTSRAGLPVPPERMFLEMA